MKVLAAAIVPLVLAGAAAQASPLLAGIKGQVEAIAPAAEALYVDLHRNPELGFQEVETAKKLASRVRALGYDVTTGVGGTGVVALLRNGPGPTVMLRAEMDALPIQEKTGLAYASRAVAKDAAGREVPVMHACGHDLHMAAWYGTAAMMAQNRAHWSGTLMLVGQPAEETLRGARAMLKDGLFTRFPKPDYALSLHDDPYLVAGKVGYRAGPFRAAVDTVEITIFGRGGHGAAPHELRDPIVLAARTVLALQTLVSRETDPFDAVVITIGSINGGSSPNVVPDEVKLQATVRTLKEDVRRRVLAGIAREVKGIALAANMPREPQVAVTPGAGSFANDAKLVTRAVAAMREVLDPDDVTEMTGRMASDDFMYFHEAGVKALLLHFGAVDASSLEQARKTGVPHPIPHSPLWAPVYKPALRAAIMAETAVLLDLLRPAR